MANRPALDALAMGDIEILEQRAVDLLAEVELGRATPAIWIGVERLVLHALADAQRTMLRRRLLVTPTAVELPRALIAPFARLSAMQQGK